MSAGQSSFLPVAVPIAVAGVSSTGLAVVVNLATGGGPLWMWTLVAALTVAGIATSVWQFQRQQSTTTPPEPSRSIEASGDRSAAVGGDAALVSTGDNVPTLPIAPPSGSSAAPASGTVTAGGTRSVAIGGNAGSISTGDQPGPPSP